MGTMVSMWTEDGDAPTSDTQVITWAKEAAEQLFKARKGYALSLYEPTDIPTAQAAVRRLGQLIDDVDGAIADVLDAARDSGELLSSDSLQGISEVIQNADDVDATQVRLSLTPTELWLGHDGNPVKLSHVLGFAMPWLSTKGDQADTNGRFGIGLMTLRALSDTIDVHCHPYHFRLAKSALSPVDPQTPPRGLDEAGWTTLRVPLDRRGISQSELEEWLDRWDDSALLFLRSVTAVASLDPDGTTIRELSISRHDASKLLPHCRNANTTVSKRRVEADDGRSWIVYSEDVPAPSGVSRARKATMETTPVAIALPQSQAASGQIHAGLPVARTRLNLFANAQFDPLTNRQDFSEDEWNQSLVPLVAELWTQAALDLFSQDPKAAWQAMPVPTTSEGDSASPFVQRLESAIIAIAREQVAAQVSFNVLGHGKLRLSQLATEAKPLEKILTPTETAGLAGLPSTLPFTARDLEGRWRQVLDDWRSAGANIPEPVSVEQALTLLGDETRSPTTTIALVAAGLEAGLNQPLSNLPCVIAQNGRHIVPPHKDSPEAVAASATPLAEQLGVVKLLHPVHLSGNSAARTVLNWLQQTGALLDEPDDLLVVRRLAAAGKASRPLETPLTDDQVQALREAFEQMEHRAELKELGPQIGKAVLLQAFQYDEKGRKKSQKVTVVARPVDAYMPSTVVGGTDSFTSAAKQSPGVLWLSNHYAKILRSPASHKGIGAQRFLSLLGAETAPRPRLHPQLVQRFTNLPKGLQDSQGPSDRSQTLSELGATYTLDDHDCPDLSAVIQDISLLRRNSKERRTRATALLASLARAWESKLSDVAEVEAANDYYDWRKKGSIAAYWLWEARDVAWLDDESGRPRRPCELRVRTPNTVAIYGENSPDYLHKELYNQDWRTVLTALGVPSDPTRAELIARLKELRDSSNDEARLTDEELKQETAVVYKALANSLSTSNRARSIRRAEIDQLHHEFQQSNGLVLSNWGWLPPQSVLTGPSIFGQYKAFAPAIADTEPLWTTLGLPQHSFDDCLEVIGKITRKRSPLELSDESVMLETLRALASHVDANGVPQQARARLRKLRLWTSQGWVRERPVYATDDLVLAEGLKAVLPMWLPGGEIEQFRPLLAPLRVEAVGATAEVVKPELATESVELSDFFRSAVRQLQDDLSRHEPELAKSARMSWEHLSQFSVHVHPSLRLQVTTGSEGTQALHECNVAAKVDQDRGTFFVQNPTELSRVDAGGRAIAALFDGNPRRLAQAWLTACSQTESGRVAQAIELAEQRNQREQEQTEQSIEQRTANLQKGIVANHRNQNQPNGPSRAAPVAADTNGRADAAKAPTPDPRRVLVDLDSLMLVNPQGELENQKLTPHRRITRDALLTEPRLGTGNHQGGASIRLYTDKDRENLGMDLLRRVLSSDLDKVKDLRAQRGVGADAIDELERFYELKVHGGPEPDQVTLTNAEVARAHNTPDYFLVIVSDVEGADANPKVRLIVDPLHQLQPTDSGAITLSGVRSATNLLYNFAQINGSPSRSQSGLPNTAGSDSF